MPSTYSSNLKIELMSTGENSGTWGDVTNTNLGTALEQAIVGYGTVDYVADANLTISITNNNASQAARALVLNVTSAFGSLTQTRELVVPTIEKQYIVQNNTTGGQSITVKTTAGTGITVPNGRKAHLYVDGTNVIQMFDFVDINGGTIDGAAIGGNAAAAGAFTTLSASGATTLNGAVTLGDAAGDNITFNGTVTSHLLFTDNTYDIGANGATRPRNLFLAGSATVGGNLSVGGTLTLTGGVNLNGNVTVGDSSSDTLTINSTITSNLLFTDNTYDIGASGATRPRNLFLAGNATIGGNQTLTGTLTVDSTTDSSSTTTGSIQTDGGLGVAKKLFVGLDANIYGLTVGRGAGAVSTNTAVGSGALAANTTGAANTAVGQLALNLETTGLRNAAFGARALQKSVGGNDNTAVGYVALSENTTGANNTAVGEAALGNLTTGSNNTALGMSALINSTTSSDNTAVGYQAAYTNTTGIRLVAVGHQALVANTTGSDNTAIGQATLASNTTGFYNVAVGGYGNAAQTLASNTTGYYNTAVGMSAMGLNTTGINNTALGAQALLSNTTASYNTAVGYQALYSNTIAANMTALGYQAGYSFAGDTGYCTLLGYRAGYSAVGTGTTSYYNTFVGARAGEAVNGSTIYSGSSNTFVGYLSGSAITTGRANVILGRYDGNQGGLDIRTASNYIVLSDGDGNPRLIGNSGGTFGMGIAPKAWRTQSIALDIGDAGFLMSNIFGSSAFGMNVGSNAYLNSSGSWIYKVSDFATWYNQNGGNHVWYTAPSGTAGTAITFTQSLAVGKDTTLALQGASSVAGTGITFPATQNASSNANTLDDYEEGAWTPGLIGGTTAGSYNFSIARGKYTKIGRLVTVNVTLVDVTQASAGSGVVIITGLPFAVDNDTAFDRAPTGALYVRQLASVITGAKDAFVVAGKNSTYVYPIWWDGQNDQNFTISNISSGSTDFGFTLTYETSN